MQAHSIRIAFPHPFPGPIPARTYIWYLSTYLWHVGEAFTHSGVQSGAPFSGPGFAYGFGLLRVCVAVE